MRRIAACFFCGLLFGAAAAAEQYPAATRTDNMSFFWNFEGDVSFDLGSVKDGFAYTGKRCLQAGTIEADWHPVRVSFGWDRKRAETIPQNPHISFAYYCEQEARATVYIEAPHVSAKDRPTLRAGEWTFVSWALKGFEENGDQVAGKTLANVMIKAGGNNRDLKLYIDDLSISNGPVESPRLRAAEPPPAEVVRAPPPREPSTFDAQAPREPAAFEAPAQPEPAAVETAALRQPVVAEVQAPPEPAERVAKQAPRGKKNWLFAVAVAALVGVAAALVVIVSRKPREQR